MATESLLASSAVLLFGRVLDDLEIKREKIKSGSKESSGKSFLQNQASADEAKLARIYGFAYEGFYYELGQPAIFLVHGDGDSVEASKSEKKRSSGAASAGLPGVAASDLSLAEDIRVWSYDQGDFSIRMDIETGPLKDILLDMELRPERLQASYSGATARLYAGATARLYAGATAQLRGGRRGPIDD